MFNTQQLEAIKPVYNRRSAVFSRLSGCVCTIIGMLAVTSHGAER